MVLLVLKIERVGEQGERGYSLAPHRKQFIAGQKP
jgi:hypothetical protein